MADSDNMFEFVLETICKHLEARVGHVRRVAEFKNGFESWLKFEFAVALREQPNVEVWRYDDEGVRDYGDVGVEYQFRRAPDSAPRAEGQVNKKLIDLWYGYSPTLYFELKTAFGHINTGKQIQSWLSDFEKLDALLGGEAEVAGYASVLLAIGLSDDAWTKALERAKSFVRSEDELWDGGLIACEADTGNDEVGPIRLYAVRRALTPVPALR